MNYNLIFLKFILIMSLYSTNCEKDWSKEQTPEYWHRQAKETLDNILKERLNKNIAKNLILFLGDGMGLTTITAGRIRKGQMTGMQRKFSLKLK